MDVKNKKQDAETTIQSELKFMLKNMDHREAWLDGYNNCDLCGSDLIYTHVTKFIEETVTEEAHCPSCNIKNKQNFHRLQ